MNDALLSSQDRQEMLSRAYVAAVIAAAGYTQSTEYPDRSGIDFYVHAAGKFRPSIGVQLKATTNIERTIRGDISYALPVGNYEKLREERTYPSILVVLEMPKNEHEWLDVTADHLVMRRCAYWLSLKGAPDTANSTSVTISLDPACRFDVEGLRALMAQARGGVIA